MIEMGWVAAAVTVVMVVGALIAYLGLRVGANMVWKQTGNDGKLIGQRAPRIDDRPAEKTG